MRFAIPQALLLTILRSPNTSAFSLRKVSASAFVARATAAAPFTSSSASSSPAFSPSSSNSVFSSSSRPSSSLNMAEKERPFTTWTFDKHCETMDWTPEPTASLSAVDASASAVAELQDADLVVVGVFAPVKDDDEEDEDAKAEEKEVDPIEFVGKAKELDEALGGALTDLAAENGKEFRNGGEAGSATPVMRVIEGGKAKRYLLLGLGPQPKDDKPIESTTLMKAAAAIATACHDQKKVASCNILLPTAIASTPSNVQDISTAFYSNLYSDNRYRTGKKVVKMAESLDAVKLFMESGTASSDDLAASITTGKQIAKGVSLTKDIVNAPHNVLNSMSLADTAKRIAEQSGGSITCTILDKKDCEERGMGAYLGVARGSETEPQFIHLTYKPSEGDIKKKVGVIGKGLLFDTGGYNIKTSMMELMKFDCGGAAAVLGAARAVGDMQPEGVEAHFIVAACENMISGRAVVPSDVLTASNGKTIEVLNTDAEGRLTLADALVYADKELGCESIIELSTLTGACMISLGKKICGVWTDDDDLAKSLEDVSKVTGDKSWRMPLAKEYNELLKSKIADISNLGGPYGGAITAALFLQNFVSKKKPFAHLDIAGPVWDDKTGATGFGSKLVSEWVRRQGQ
mmetsp:Transcript_24870/g.49527  ORF Transcript_24870/g.49527 Transcript_24870/m.49527 type:complete len:633 (+) Transcript_24870:95-1993(+)